MRLSQHAINSYRSSLKGWLGYVASGHYASLLELPLVEALGLLLGDSGHMDDFLKRYRVRERDRRRQEVRYVVLLWLIDLAE